MKSNAKFCGVGVTLVLMFLMVMPATAQIVQSGSILIDLSEEKKAAPTPGSAGMDDELLVNSGFETGTFDPWYHDGAWTISTNNPHAGTYCAYDVGNHWLRQDITPTPASEIVSATLWCRQPEEAISAIDFFYSTGSYSEDLIWPTATWQQYDVTGFIEPGQTVVAIRVWGYSGGGPDPDETFFDDVSIQTLGGPPDVTVVLDPIGGPIVIPAAGGSFDYTAVLSNNGTSPATFDVWVMVQLPSMVWYGPVLGPVNITLPATTSIARDRTQTVPVGAPAGDYLYEARVGLYPGTIWDSDNFPFEKLMDGDGPIVEDWTNSGESLETWLTAPEAEIPNDFTLLGAYPNPFNPTSTICFALPEAARVNLSVYDVSGRQVATLVNGWREAGSHEVIFDASGLASGMYIYRIDAADFAGFGKIVLTK